MSRIRDLIASVDPIPTVGSDDFYTYPLAEQRLISKCGDDKLRLLKLLRRNKRRLGAKTVAASGIIPVTVVPCVQELLETFAMDQTPGQSYTTQSNAGEGCCISGNTLWIGVAGGDNEDVDGFPRSGNVERWTRADENTEFSYDTHIWQNTPVNAGRFGTCIAYDPATGVLMVGQDDQPTGGRVICFDDEGDTWRQDISPNHLESTAKFGGAIALSGAHMLVGSPDIDPSGYGSVEYHEDVAGTWTYRSTFQTPVADTNTTMHFGGGVAMDGDSTAYVSRIGDATGGDKTDSITIEKWTRSGTTWSFDSSWTDTTTDVGQGSGPAKVPLSLSGSLLAVGRPDAHTPANNAGTVRFYNVDDGTYLGEILGSDNAGGIADEGFGTGICLDGTELVAGAPFNDDQSLNEGQSYLWNVCF